MAVKFLDNTGLGYFWGKIKAWCSSTFAAIAHTHTSYAVKHSYTTAANQAKAWLRIANANTHQMDTNKPLHVQFLLTAWNPDQPADYYAQWFVDCQIFGKNSGIRIFGTSGAPFSQARVLYENTNIDIDTNDRPAIDIYLSYVLTTACHVEIQEVYNSGWTFLADGVLAVSTVPTGFENRAVGVYGSGIANAGHCDYAARTRLQRSNITANITLANNDTYRSRVLNCTNAITVTVPSLDSDYAWFLIKNFNATSTTNNVTIHPSTTSVKIDDSNADIVLKPGEWVIIASKAANSYTLIGDSRWKSQKADKATTLAGYGITDAKIANGTITLGSNSITPITSHQTLPTLSRTISGSGNAITDITVSNHAITATKGSTFALDSDVIHKDSNEAIEGIKEFSNSYYDSTRPSESDWESSSIILRLKNYDKGTVPDTAYMGNLIVLDKDGTNQNWNGRLGVFEYSVGPDYGSATRISAYKNEVVNGVDTHENATLGVGYDIDGIKYAYAPSTSETRTAGFDILTRDWIPKDTRIVHTTGNETIAGTKTFSSTITGSISGNATTVSGTAGTSLLAWNTENTVYTVGGHAIKVKLPANPNTNTTYTFATGDSNGQIKVTPSGGSAQNVSVKGLGTAAYKADTYFAVDSNVVHTTGNESISGIKVFNNNIAEKRASLAKGEAPSENLYYNFVFVDKNSTTSDIGIAKRFGGLETQVSTNKDTSTYLIAYQNVADGTANVSLGVTTNSTYDFDFRYAFVRNGNFKLFDNYSYICIANSDFIRGTAPSTALYDAPIKFMDANGNLFSQLYCVYNTDKANYISFLVAKGTDTSNTSEQLGIGFNGDGDAYTRCPHPTDSSNTWNIATTYWVRRYCETTKGYITSSGSITGNAATATTLSPQAAAALPTGNLSKDGLQLFEVYNNSYPYSYGNVINVQGSSHKGAGQLFLAWSGTNNGIANVYYRNKRDQATTWSDWKQLAFTDSDITGNAATATKIQTSTSAATYVSAATSGGALVNNTTTTFGGVWNAPTKDYMVACATYPSGNNNVYLCYSITNANISSNTNTIAKSLIWNADTGILAASTPETSDNSGNVATTAFVKAQGYLTSHQSLSNYVTLNSVQTITSNKTFSSSIISNVNPIIKRANNTGHIDICGGSDTTNTSGAKIVLRGSSEASGTAGELILQGGNSSSYNYISVRPDMIYVTGGGLSFDKYHNSYILKFAEDYPNNGACIFAGTQNFDGAGLILFGRTQDSANNNHGKFYLRASRRSTTNGTGDARTLTGTPDGSIYWNGQAIQTSSDERLKTDFNSVDDSILDGWDNVNWIQFKYKDAVAEKGTNARYHVGLIAQHVSKQFENLETQIEKYGIVCHEYEKEHYIESTVVDAQAYTDDEGVYHEEKSHIEREFMPGRDEWTVRYTEALCMEAAYQRRKNKILENRISELEKQVSDMIILLQNLTNGNG